MQFSVSFECRDKIGNFENNFLLQISALTPKKNLTPFYLEYVVRLGQISMKTRKAKECKNWKKNFSIHYLQSEPSNMYQKAT